MTAVREHTVIYELIDIRISLQQTRLVFVILHYCPTFAGCLQSVFCLFSYREYFKLFFKLVVRWLRCDKFAAFMNKITWL